MKPLSTFKFLIKNISPFLFIITAVNCMGQNDRPQGLVLKNNWTIQSSAKVESSGEDISSVTYPANDWYPTTVPTTVLSALVDNNVYPDPNYGTNLSVIPGSLLSIRTTSDMPLDSPFAVPWWYRTEFQLPSEFDGENMWLKLHSVNYKANVWLNGHLIADTSKVIGAYRLFELEITKAALPGRKNCLALEIFPPVKGTDPSIRWMQGTQMPPDRDTGIWYNMKILTSGPLRIKHPKVITDLDLPSTKAAHITISTDLVNMTDKPIEGVLKGVITNVNNISEGGTSDGGDQVFDIAESISLSPGETRKITQKLDIPNPKLWWPSIVGKQHLYDLNLRLLTDDQKLSDIETIRFGIRKVTSELKLYDHGIRTRVFQVNGKNIMVKGANYTDSMMFEHNENREEHEAKYIIQMNLNAIRTEGFWGTDHFYDLCDKYGIMIFDGTNCCSIWERWDLWKKETYEIAGMSLRDQIIRKRNHPCFVDWLIGSDKSPPPDVEKMYVDIIEKYDGTRPYQSNAYTDSTAVCGWTGLSHDPYPETYAYLPPSTWYGAGDLGKYEFLEFNTEVGPGGEQIPPIESMREMMPKEDLWPISGSWNLRLWRTQSPQSRAALYSRYGQPTDIEEYTVKSQVLQKEAMRAMCEAFRKNKYKASGILIYRLNAGWPSLCYHLYDYFLRPNGAFYGVQEAFEPLHVQFSYDDNSVFVVNGYYQDFNNLKVSAKVLNFDMSVMYSKDITMDIAADGNKPAFTIPPIEGLSDNYFLTLSLKNSSGEEKSSNFYWFSSKGDQKADFRDLMKLSPVKLNVKGKYHEKGDKSKVILTIENPSDDLAFFINPSLIRGEHGAEILPVFWSANYFSLLPHESREISVTFDAEYLDGEKPNVIVGGWNIEPSEIDIERQKIVTPALTYKNFSVPEQIKTGKEFKVSITVQNSAESGAGLLKAQQYLYIDGKPVNFKRVALAPGEVKELVWSTIKLDQAGKHEIKIGNSGPVNLTVN